MPQSRERKREYMRRYMAKRRSRGGRSGRGVSPLSVGPLLVPDSYKGSVSPWFPLVDVRRKYQRRFVEYLLSLNKAGYTLQPEDGGYRLVETPVTRSEREIAEMGARQAELEARQAELEARQVGLADKVLRAHDRNTQLEADMIRIEAMMDSVLAEGPW